MAAASIVIFPGQNLQVVVDALGNCPTIIYGAAFQDDSRAMINAD